MQVLSKYLLDWLDNQTKLSQMYKIIFGGIKNFPCHSGIKMEKVQKVPLISAIEANSAF